MKNQRAVLLALAVAWNAVAAPPAQTNDVHQPALDLLRKTINDLEQRSKTPPPTAVPSAHDPAFANAEKLYLHGKISAKEFQKYLEDHKLEPASVKNVDVDAQTRALEVLHKQPVRAEAGQSTPAAAAAIPPEAQTDAAVAAEQSSLSELEKKMDELLRLKAAREQVVATNAVPNSANKTAAPSAPKTKRERLDQLLKLLIDGKIADAEYKEQRGKLMAEPD